MSNNKDLLLSSRRSFVKTLGLSLLAAPSMLADGQRRRSRREMFANDEPIAVPQFKPEPRTWSNDTITAAWIGHATVLINFYGTNIITDPVFSDRIGLNVAHLFTIGPKRLVYPALTFDELPPIDLILLSHAHMDHLDTPTIRKFNRNIPMVIAQNTHDVVEDFRFEKVYQLDWGQWAQIGDVRVEALEVKHFGWRYPWEQDRSRGYHDGRSYNAYLLSRNGKQIVFGGDTAYHEHFKKIGERNIPVELAMVPIGAYDPWIHNHCTPEQALEMAGHMNARRILPMHWNTFIQSEEPTAEPMQRLKAAAAHDPDRIVIDSIGQTWTLPRTAASTATVPTATNTSE
ncbi:MAG: MBL fold metallo-hydrolase [Bacteroidetes bacterium]|nr:MBL fold metallo-hydrolase [Bacteroidota bacterium]MCW5894742.1 MBL fold metallo-hydrolase [Bacteroidota bacterium]